MLNVLTVCNYCLCSGFSCFKSSRRIFIGSKTINGARIITETKQFQMQSSSNYDNKHWLKIQCLQRNHLWVAGNIFLHNFIHSHFLFTWYFLIAYLYGKKMWIRNMMVVYSSGYNLWQYIIISIEYVIFWCLCCLIVN